MDGSSSPAAAQSTIAADASARELRPVNPLRGFVTATISARTKSEKLVGHRAAATALLPVSSRFGAEYPQCGAGDQVALKVEGIVDGGMHAQETLGGSS